MLRSPTSNEPHERCDTTTTTTTNKNSNNGIVTPPRYTRKTQVLEHFGDVRHDPYYWLRDRRNAEVRRLLRRENNHTESMFTACGGTKLCRTLFREMRARWKEDDATLPHRDGGFWYYTRTLTGADHPLLCRRPVPTTATDADAIYGSAAGCSSSFVRDVARLWAQDPTAPLPSCDEEEVYLDVNLLMRELRLRSVELGDAEVSPDGRRLAVAIDCSNGKEVYTIFVLNIADVNYGQWLRDHSQIHRAWAEAVERGNQSIYASPTTRLPPQRSPTTSNGGRVRGRVHDSNRNNKLGTNGTEMSLEFPLRKNATEAEMEVDASSPSPTTRTTTATTCIEFSSSFSSPSFSSPSVPTNQTRTRQAPPAHKITRRIDVFDAAEEVLWLSPNALLYVGIDSKMRPCRVIHHDLTVPVNSGRTDTVCYEESDEAFWVSSLCFTADERFANFTVASGNCTEVYVIPCDAATRRCVTGVPLLRGSVIEEEKGDHNKNDDDEEEGQCENINIDSSNGSSVHECNKENSCPVFCLLGRESRVDYDVDHHDAFFGEGIGAWVMVTANPLRTEEDFHIAYLLDDEIVWGEKKDDHNSCGSTHIISSVSQWQSLFEHDPYISVDGVECQRDFLLISARCSAFPTVFLLPICTLWNRWRNNNNNKTSSTTSVRYIEPLSLRYDAVDLYAIACRAPSRPLAEVCFPVAELLQQQRQQQVKEKNETKAEDKLKRNYDGRLHGVMSSTEDTSFNARSWRIVVTHLTTPTTTLACTLEVRRMKKDSNNNVKEEEEEEEAVLHVTRLCDAVVCGNPYESNDYDASVVWVPSDYAFRNGLRPLPTAVPAETVDIPVYMCWRKSLRAPGGNPMLLNVYGSYGDCCDVEFESERLVLLDRGFVWAVAAVRGGGELGVGWRNAGRRLQRATTVNDFVSVALYMQREEGEEEKSSWCAPGGLVIAGASAGGFVVAAAMNLAPSLARGVIATVPFVDCLTTLLDRNLPLTVCDWDEFGNPQEDATVYHMIRAISPMDNIPPPGVVLPHLLLQTAWNDTRVGYWESLAFAARLRERVGTSALSTTFDANNNSNSNNNNNNKSINANSSSSGSRNGGIILHHCDFGVGHGGASGRYQRLKEIAREYAFAILVQQAT